MVRGKQKKVHRTLGAGRWFPANHGALESMVNTYIDAATVPPIEGRIVGAISPHAGYVYSGSVAGYTFRAIRDNIKAGHKPDTVVVLGFSHRGGFEGVALLDGDAIETPMGALRLDAEAGRALARGNGRIEFNETPHHGEHSAENQIPFVRAVLPKCGLVVGLVGDHEEETRKQLVSGLKRLARKCSLLVIASSDLLHDPDYELVVETDRETLGLLSGMDVDGLLSRWSYASQPCCGIGPVAASMQFALSEGCRQGTVVHYRNSGDDFPESRGEWVVGYGACVFAAPA